MSERPNILLIMADQMTAFALSAYGNSVTRTPHLDALAEAGTVFENAYCNYPLCAPARYGLVSGRLPSRIGAFDNAAELPAAVPTVAHYLRDAGYYTCLSGKMHFVGPDQHHGFEDRLTTEIYPADFAWTPAHTYDDMPDPETLALAADAAPLGVSSVETIAEAGPVARSLQMDYDDDVVHRACQHLYDRRRYGDGRPLFMTVSFTQPHDPYVSRQEFWDLYADDHIADPTVPAIPVAAMDPQSRGQYYHYSLHKFPITPALYRRARRGYYAMISDVDAKLGQLRRTLADCGLASNTLIVFTSDHGDMLGERGLWFKKTLFEPAVRVPMILHWPGRPCRPRVDAPVSLVDLLPSLLDAATGSTDALVGECDGRSLLPLLDADRSGRTVRAEHIEGATLGPRVMLREGALKLVYSEVYPTQLYDLANDPAERHNLAGHPDWRQQQRRLTDAALDDWDLAALKRQVIDNQKARQMVYRSLAKGHIRDWEHYPNPARFSTRQVRRGDTFPEVEQRGYLRYPTE